MPADLRDDHRHLVEIAPAPVLPGLERADQRVPARPMMGGGVAVGRVVTAAHVPAGQTDAQMQPDAPRAQAVLAPVDAGRQFG